jgi:uncharacterized protein
MTPQERDLITSLLQRLKQAGGQPKDPEADALIRQSMGSQPDMPYYLVQTVLIQDMALANAQNRIAELEKRVAQPQPPAQPTSFLGSLFGRGSSSSNAPSAPPPAAPPSGGPWGRPAAQPQYQGQPQYPSQPQYAPQPGAPMPMAAPMGAGQSVFGGGGGSGFLRSAATTAAGVAGGALLFQGIESLFGQHAAGGILGNTPMQPGISETVINNYYEEPGAGPDTGGDYAASDAPDRDQDVDYASDQDLSGDTDYGSDTGGGGGDDYV